MTLIVLVEDVPLAQAVAAAGTESLVDVLAFNGAGELTPSLVEALGTRIREVLPARDIMREAVPIAREKFVRFTAEWSARRIVFGQDFRDAFRRGGRSAWWFTDLSHKNAGTRPTFSRLCELEALRLVLQRGSYERAVVVGRDRDQTRVLAEACARIDVKVAVAPPPTTRDGDSFPWLCLGRAKRLVLDAAATVLARWHRLPGAIALDGGRRSLAFCTSFPTQWKTWNGVLRDRYYVDVPELIQQKTDWQVFYASDLPAPSLRALRSNARAAARFTSDKPDALTFLERWSSVWDVCRIYMDLRWPLKYWWLESFNRRFRRSFCWDGIDIFPLVRHDLRASLVRDLPYHELLAHRVRRMIAHLRPTDLVTIVETFPRGRAVMCGARVADPCLRIIGFQHSVANANQLMYRFMPGELPDMPLPDVFLLYGENLKRMLSSAGLPDRRLIVTGARRFDRLIECRRRRREQFAELRREWANDRRTRIVLVATNFWTHISRRLVRMCVEALADRPDTLIIVKPHPNHRPTEDEVRLPAGARAQAIVVDADLNDLQAAADVMVGAVGTSDAEALAIGCPVVRVALTYFDFSPTADEPGAVTEVENAAGLRVAIDEVLASTAMPSAASHLVERAFFRLDGLAGERVLSALAALDRSPASATA